MGNLTTANKMKTERDWLNEIATESDFAVQVVEETLLRYGVRAQSTPPRAKKVLFRSLSFAGTKVGSQSDGPFEFEWAELDTGLWAVMSDGNLRGKSSVMNMLYAALRGDFPGNIKPDVWKWLSRLTVVIRIDVIDYKIHIEKDSGIEDNAQARAQLCRRDDDNWTDLYAGAVGVGLKEQTESLFMDELGFTKIHASNKQGVSHTHGWPTVAAALAIGGHSEGKALFGDILLDGLPLRLLQMFIGLPWVSTLAAATTAAKMLELGSQNKEKSGDTFAEIRTRLTVIEAELESERKKAPIAYDRIELRRSMNQLDAKLVQAQIETAAARGVVNSHFAVQQELLSTRNEVARLIQQLSDERAAGYMFRQLRPVCCPACEADFQAALPPVATNDETCPLCKNDLPLATAITDERLEVAEQDLKDVTVAFKSAELALKAAEELLASTDARKQEIETNLAAIQVKLGQQSEDGELRIAELNATIKELKSLLGENATAPKPAQNPDKTILAAAMKMTKLMFEELQRDVLIDVSAAIKRLAVKFGVGNVAEMTLNSGGQLRIVQGGAKTSFSNLAPGERLRVKIAAALAAVEVARQRGLGRHPGLLLLDSPGAEEVVSPDFHQMLLSVATVTKEMGGVQIIIGTVYRPELEGIVPSGHRKYAQKDNYLF